MDQGKIAAISEMVNVQFRNYYAKRKDHWSTFGIMNLIRELNNKHMDFRF